MNKFHDQSPEISLIHSLSAVMESMENRIVEKLCGISNDLKHVVRHVDRENYNKFQSSYCQVRPGYAVDMTRDIAHPGPVPRFQSHYDNLRRARKCGLHVVYSSHSSNREDKQCFHRNFRSTENAFHMPNIPCTPRSPQAGTPPDDATESENSQSGSGGGGAAIEISMETSAVQQRPAAPTPSDPLKPATAAAAAASVAAAASAANVQIQVPAA
mmetsp:Transcript_60952/g.127766  ORF Transcript_60952/g.127766 Transcript_60952/m.127766 type:complete len:214 (-) Transcript_60952:68-709(-)